MPDLPDPLVEATKAVYDKLSADAGLQPDAVGTLAPGGVWEAKGVTDLPGYPAAMFMVTPIGTDYTLTGPYRHRLSLAFTVVDKAESVDAAAAVAARIYTLLQDADDSDLVMANFDVLFCRRRLRNRTSQVKEGETYQQVVEQYDLQVRPN